MAWPSNRLALIVVILGLILAWNAPNCVRATDGSGAITVVTRFAAGPGVLDAEGVVLAGIAEKPEARPDVALVWSPVEEGWFGKVWGVQLAVSHDVLSETAGAKRATGGLLQGSSYVSLALGAPVPGHEYEAVLAYTPESGLITAVITDLTDGTRIAAWGGRVKPRSGPEGESGSERAFGEGCVTYSGEGPAGSVRLDHIVRAHLPVALEWTVAQPRHDGTLEATTTLNRVRPMRLQLRLPGPAVEGELVLELRQGDLRQEIARAENPEHLWTREILLEKIAPGTYELVTTYISGETVWEANRLAVRVGRMQAALPNVNVSPVAGRVLIEGTLAVEADGPLATPELAVDVSIVRYTFGMPAGIGSGTISQEIVLSERLPVAAPETWTEADGRFVLEAPFAGVIDWASGEDAVWQVTMQPVAEPAELLAEAIPSHRWLGKEARPFSWDGFLQVGQKYVNEVVPGVVLYRARGEIGAGPIDLYLLEVDLAQPGIRLEAMTGGAYVSKEARWPRGLVSDMVTQTEAVAGVNGSFFYLDTMLPRSMLVRNWEMLRSPGPAENAVFGVSRDGKPYVGVWEWSATLRKADAPDGSPVRISGVNPRTHGRHGVVVYRAPWRHSPGTTPWDEYDVAEGVVEAVVRTVKLEEPGRITGVITELRVNQPGVALDEPNMLVVSGRGSGAASLLANFKVGDRIAIAYELLPEEGWYGLPGVQDLRTAVSGGVVLVRDGVYGGPHIFGDTGRHPRAAVGVSYDRSKVYFLVADGRSQRSVGLTYKELADFFLHLGVFEALNLDSGGSSTMVIRPDGNGLARVMNYPSDGTERPVADGIGVYVVR